MNSEFDGRWAELGREAMKQVKQWRLFAGTEWFHQAHRQAAESMQHASQIVVRHHADLRGDGGGCDVALGDESGQADDQGRNQLHRARTATGHKLSRVSLFLH